MKLASVTTIAFLLGACAHNGNLSTPHSNTIILGRTGVLGDHVLNARVRALGDLTLGVYVLHFAVLIAVRGFVPGLAFSQTKDSLPLALVQWAVVVVLSFASAAVLARIPIARRLIGL